MKFVEYTTNDRLGYITINRPEKRNALNFELVKELRHAFVEVENDQNIKVVILRANGEVFCAGADLDFLKQLQNSSYEENLEDSRNLKELFRLIYKLKKIVIAQIQGHAIAGGAGLVSVCDFCFSVPEARFGFTEVKIGFVPAIVMVFLLCKIPNHQARELLLTGNLVNAQKAAEIGLVNWIVPKSDIEGQVLQFAQDLCLNNSHTSMATTKEMMAELLTPNLEESLEYSSRMNAESRSTEDWLKGISAFLAKKKITW